MKRQNEEEKHQTTYSYIMRKIDIYGEPLQWYIGKNETYRTVAGGFKSFLVILISIIFLLYSIIKLIKNREGSFIMYDITYSELNDTTIFYFDDLEIFLFFKSTTSIINIDRKLINVFLAQINNIDNTFISKYEFEECDNDYFVNQLGFSDYIKGNLEKTYCINKNTYKNEKITFSLSQNSPLGNNIKSFKIIFTQNCESEICTNEEIQIFNDIINLIEDIKIFIKTKRVNPLDLKNPIQNEVISISLTRNFKSISIYLKKFNMTTQSSIIPYFFGNKKESFISYDYQEKNLRSDNDSNSFYLDFKLSSKVSYLERNYEQLDSALGNFMGVFNGFEFIGSLLTFIFDSFSKEIFMFNYVLRNRLFVKKKLFSNPPKISNSNSNSNNNSNNLNSIVHDMEIKNFDFEIKNKKKKNVNVNISKNNFYTDDNLNEKNQKNLSEKESKDVIIISENIKNNNNSKYKNIKKEQKENIEEIKINMFKSFWCNILMAFDVEKSNIPEIQISLDKIRLIQDLFDTSIYINLILDMMRLKKVIFNPYQLKLFESIHFTMDELKDYLNKFSSNEDISNEKIILQNIERVNKKKKSKITENIISVLNEQINIE